MTDTNKQIDDAKLKQALLKDFKKLLVKEFTSDWQIQRTIMELNISVMELDNVKAKLHDLMVRERISEIERANGLNSYGGFNSYSTIIISPDYADDRIKSLEATLNNEEASSD